MMEYTQRNLPPIHRCVQDPHNRALCHAAWRLIWDHIQVQCTPLTPIPNFMLPEDLAEIIYRYNIQRHAARRLSWDHIQVQCMPLTPYQTSCCLETQLRSYQVFTVLVPQAITMSCCQETQLRSYQVQCTWSHESHVSGLVSKILN